MDFATIILSLMSRDSLGSKQTIKLHNCLIRNERYNNRIHRIKNKKKVSYSEAKNKVLSESFLKHDTQSRSFGIR